MNFAAPLAVDPLLTLPGRVMLAPMHGVMSAAFAAALDECGLASAAITPFLSVSKGSVPSATALRRHLKAWRHTPESPRIIQLLGRDPEELAETALRLAGLGFPAVNLNFACPAPVVVAKGHGGACLKDPALIGRIVGTVRRRTEGKVSLSVKLRTGWDSPDEATEVLKAVRDAGASLAVVHFRTVREMYSAVEDPYARLALCRKAVPGFPLFGNGDILTAADAHAMCEVSGCDGAAAARGVWRNPRLLCEIEGRSGGGLPDAYAFLRVLCRHTLAQKTWPRNGFLECVKFAFGEESEEFRRIAQLPDEAVRAEFS